jgi:hypothetical protein
MAPLDTEVVDGAVVEPGALGEAGAGLGALDETSAATAALDNCVLEGAVGAVGAVGVAVVDGASFDFLLGLHSGSG